METKPIKKLRFASLDGLRAISCIGIMMMHIQANTYYEVQGFTWSVLIPSFTHLVILFLMLSGFGMCAGYLEKFWNGTIDLAAFYKRRYTRLLPFFVFLMLIAFIMEPSVHHLYDISMEVSLLYGLLPNNALDVIGVGWTIGVIFLFYLLFPAFSVLMRKKKTAWISLFVSLWVQFICLQYYFTGNFVNELFTPRHNFLYCAPYFIAGGIIFLYKDSLRSLCSSWKRCFFLVLCVVISILYYFVPKKIGTINILPYLNLVLYSAWISYFVGVDSKIMCNSVMKFLGSISMEIYLSHMFVFRAFERLGILYKFGNRGGGYICIVILTLLGTVCLAVVWRFVVSKIKASFAGLKLKQGGKIEQ